MGKLILVRHGKTVLNSYDNQERLRGWLDVSLDEQGLNEALQTGQRVAEHSIAHVYSSDLLRARQTTEAIARSTGAPVEHTLALRPWNVGTLAGQRVKDILPILEHLERDPTYPAPGGESFLDFCARYLSKLEELLKTAARSNGHIIAVTHVRNLLAAPVLLNGGNKRHIPVKGGPDTGSLVWVENSGKGWSLREDKACLSAGQDRLEKERNSGAAGDQFRLLLSHTKLETI
jgi:broad specificity phosphatase PhoE